MARKSTALAYISFTCTQGSADAFVQTSIATALTGQTKTCYRMASLDLEYPIPVATTLVDYQWAMTRKSYAAFPTSMNLEKSNIWYHRRGMIVGSGVGFSLYDRTYHWTWNDDDAPLIVEDPIYVQLDTAATSLSNVVYGRIGYWLDSINEVDRLQLIANSLS